MVLLSFWLVYVRLLSSKLANANASIAARSAANYSAADGVASIRAKNAARLVQPFTEPDRTSVREEQQMTKPALIFNTFTPSLTLGVHGDGIRLFLIGWPTLVTGAKEAAVQWGRQKAETVLTVCFSVQIQGAGESSGLR